MINLTNEENIRHYEKMPPGLIEIRQEYGYRVHRPLGHYLNAVIRHHGLIKEAVEPQLDPALPFAEDERDRHVPSFMVIHAVKWAGI